jgi:hypothetical protein
LWIDGVGGYLVCLGSRLSLGQAVPDTAVEIPLSADVARMHATLLRDPEGWVLEAIRSAQVNNQPTTRTLLRTGDRITLGSSCQLVFRQSVALSASARLDLVSGHRLPLALDGVLLMADTLFLGDGPQVHVTLPGRKEPLILFRNKDSLGVKNDGPLSIDGQVLPGQRALLPERCCVSAGDVTFSVEPVGTRLGTV